MGKKPLTEGGLGIYPVTAERPTFNLCIYGDAGSGKTTLAASAQDAPFMKDVLFLNVEGGLLSVAHRGDLHAIDIKSTDQLEEVFWAIAKGELPVQTVVLDSATELQTLNLEEIVATNMDKPSRTGKKRTSRDDIWQDDYGQSTAQLKRLIRGFRDLPINFIMTALAKYVYPKNVDTSVAEPTVVLPSLTQKLAESAMGYMDFVWYCFYDSESSQFRVLTQTEGAFRAKTRGPMFLKKLGQTVPIRNVTTGNGAENAMDLKGIYDLFVSTTHEGRK